MLWQKNRILTAYPRGWKQSGQMQNSASCRYHPKNKKAGEIHRGDRTHPERSLSQKCFGGIFAPIFRKCGTSHRKKATMRYYVCYSSDCRELDFEKKCTKATWDDTVFEALDGDGVCFGIIPSISVNAFVSKEV